MTELIGAGLVAIAGLFGHVKSKDFVRRRLRFTKFVKRPGRLGVLAGVATAAAVAPVVAVLPLVGAGSAVFLGVAVGAGTALGARDARDNKALPREKDDWA